MTLEQKHSKMPALVNLSHLGSSLHEAAASGDKKRLKQILKIGITCDYPNSRGETPLFCACLKEKLSIVGILLKHGADPNTRSGTGITPVHAACYTCNSVLLGMLLEAGGDLRLHDDSGKGIMHFINEQTDPVKKAKMLNFIEQVRSSTLAISKGKKETERTLGISNTKKERKKTSIVNLLKFKSNYRSPQSFPSGLSSGFGKLYVNDPKNSGIIAMIPLVKENSLEHDDNGCTYDNGSFMVMESMFWNGLPVTVKRLHQKPRQGGNVNLLINENEYMARLRHPSILLIMAVYQTDNLEGLQLLYERVSLGSLYSYLYTKLMVLDTQAICEIIKQISQALLYLHQMNLIHCYITSHAIQLVQQNIAKLCNFEYMTESADGAIPRNKVVHNRYINAAFNWIAPEVITGSQPTKQSDVYSICAVLWELLHGTPPWHGMHATDIETEVAQKKKMLEIEESMKEPFSTLLRHGLAVEPMERSLTLEQFIKSLKRFLTESENRSVNSSTSYPHLKGYSSHSVFSVDKKWKSLKPEEKVEVSDTEEVNNSSTQNMANQNKTEGNDSHKNYLSVYEQQISPVQSPGASSSKNKQNKYWENSSSTPTPDLTANGHSTQQNASNKTKLSFEEMSDQNQNSNHEALIAVKANTEVSPGGDSLRFDGMGVKFTVDIAKSKYFETRLTKPKLTSTPDSGISSTKLITDKKVISMIEESSIKKSDTVSEKGDGENLTNPFKKEYEDLKSQNLAANYSATTFKQSLYPTFTTDQTEIKSMSAFTNVSLHKGQNFFELSPKKHTVCGTLLQDRVVHSNKHTALLNDDLEKLDDDDKPNRATGPIYLYPRRNVHQILANARFSCTSLPQAHKTRVAPRSLDTTKTCHDMMVSTNPNMSCHAYKPASHVSSYTTYSYDSTTLPSNKQILDNIRASKRGEGRSMNTAVSTSPDRLSPLEKKDEWYAETGSIKKIIASYQNLIKEHVRKQAVLVMKTKQKQEVSMADERHDEQEKNQIYSKPEKPEKRQELHEVIPETKKRQALPEVMAETTQTQEIPNVLQNVVCPEKMDEPAPSRRQVETTPSGDARRSGDARSSGDATSTHQRRGVEQSDVSSSPCPCHLVTKTPAHMGPESETDQEVSDIVDNVLFNVYSEVIEKHTHPDCPHKAEILSEIKAHQKLNSANAEQLKHTTEVAIQTENTDKEANVGYEDERIQTEDIYIDDDFTSNLDNQIHMLLQGNRPSSTGNNGSSVNTSKDTDNLTDANMKNGFLSPAGGDNPMNNMTSNQHVFNQIYFDEDPVGT